MVITVTIVTKYLYSQDTKETAMHIGLMGTSQITLDRDLYTVASSIPGQSKHSYNVSPKPAILNLNPNPHILKTLRGGSGGMSK